MSNENSPDIHVYQHYCPPGVKRVLASGASAFIGEVDDSTVFKYPLAPGQDMVRLEIEGKLLSIIGPHERIIGLKGISEEGLYLERATNGTVAQRIESEETIPMEQRLAWCREAAEAVAQVHVHNIVHCDIQPTNLLLDDHLHLKLSDFQGKQLSKSGMVLLDGWSSEPCRFYCPRNDPDDANVKTDLFALGCTIYYIMTSHAVFPDIIDGEDDWQETIERRFRSMQFPQDQHVCDAITLKCWKMEYETAEDIVRDLKSLEGA
ncbi:kinase-like protein [Cucurbitaria berberidis CBS 394.84]|uniref:Kinase-like protein n=1 Tax=Cucurbitaria berberidis CBS 394.84 TaxID=1168544 RepID=A0A9P4GF86_9PLEO|nr:kinase-like protein [Cucurbitaria berberidis CBS 394.84]KAF1844396.1 kinase-like protein [Cucurbitaria berberidis CBS 394.84]